MKFKLLIASGLLSTNPFGEDTGIGMHPEDKSFDRKAIQTFFQELTSSINVDKSIDDWTVLLQIKLGNCLECKEIIVCKRGVTYPSDKEKNVFISIPLFTKNEISWGIEDTRRYLHKEKKYNLKYCEEVAFDYRKYTCVEDYLNDALKFSIQYIFEKGFTLKGKKIKLKT